MSMNWKITENRYTLVQREDGFDILAADRNPVHIDLLPTRLLVRYDAWYGEHAKHILLFDFYGLVDDFAEGLIQFRGYSADLRSRAQQALVNYLRGQIWKEWKRLMDLLPDSVRAVQQKVFAVAFTKPVSILNNLNLYTNQDLVQDIITYRAAALAVSEIGYLANNF